MGWSGCSGLAARAAGIEVECSLVPTAFAPPMSELVRVSVAMSEPSRPLVATSASVMLAAERPRR